MPQPVTGPIPAPPPDGIRAERGRALAENPNAAAEGTRWIGGYAFASQPCSGAGAFDPCDSPTLPSPAETEGEVSVTPFPVVIGRRCSTYGWDSTDFVADATRLLESMQWAVLADELWRGTLSAAASWTNPYLSDDSNAAYVDLGGPFTPVETLSVLEDGLSQCSPGLSVIHASKRLAIYWGSEGLLQREGNRLRTVLGTPVIADNGYDGSGPASGGHVAATASQMWAYGTGPLHLRIETGQPHISPPAGDLPAAVSKAVNDIVYYAQRMASITWDWGCCHLGISASVV